MFLEVSRLEVRYPARPRPAVQDVSLQLPAGDIGVLIGPSGCGKTTLLRAIAGLEPVAQGEIRLQSELVSSARSQVPAEKRRIGMVFQDYALFPHLSVGRNVAFGIHHWSRPDQARRVQEVLALVGLGQSADRYPHELSGGQQQRVALARALAPRPQLMLLDEPFSNLDVELRERLAFEVRDILKTAGATAVFVTHDQLEAFAIGDAVGVMQDGQLHQWADAATLYQRPASRFVADFIGHGAFVPATVAQSPDGCTVDTPLGPLPLAAADAPRPGARELLLRASDVVCDPTAPTQARLLRKAFRGSLTLYTLELPSGHTVYAQVASEQAHAVGEHVGVRAQPEQLLFF
ncbi:ABC transporter ATP-binding protein [Comamonas humi]